MEQAVKLNEVREVTDDELDAVAGGRATYLTYLYAETPERVIVWHGKAT